MKIDVTLARNLVRAQFPQWAALEIRPVAQSGWDNRTFHLGDEMLLRLPSAARYEHQVAKEQKWLPWLGERLSFAVPQPVARGVAGCGYPYEWSVYRWLEGETALVFTCDRCQLARDLARCLRELQSLPVDGAPRPSSDNFYRGEHPTHYEEEVLAALVNLGDDFDADEILALWKKWTASSWAAAPCWLHGDVSPGNLLLRDERLCGLIDFGGLAVGDPACDLAIAWTFFRGESRQEYRVALGVDEATWWRGAAWALWKALIVFAGNCEGERVAAKVVLEELSPSVF